jgi:hypothetical protein
LTGSDEVATTPTSESQTSKHKKTPSLSPEEFIDHYKIDLSKYPEFPSGGITKLGTMDVQMGHVRGTKPPGNIMWDKKVALRRQTFELAKRGEKKDICLDIVRNLRFVQRYDVNGEWYEVTEEDKLKKTSDKLTYLRKKENRETVGSEPTAASTDYIDHEPAPPFDTRMAGTHRLSFVDKVVSHDLP